MPIATSPKLKVAIVGAGPGGLATTIQFRRLDNVEVQVFDQARELREVGAVSLKRASNSRLMCRESASTTTHGDCFKILKPQMPWSSLPAALRKAL